MSEELSPEETYKSYIPHILFTLQNPGSWVSEHSEIKDFICEETDKLEE